MKNIFIETYGCSYGASLHDDFNDLKADKWLGVKQLYKIGLKKPDKVNEKYLMSKQLTVWQ